MNKDYILSKLDIANYYKSLIPTLRVNDRTQAQSLCVFHEDRHPSLSINLKNGLFNCFACNASGDVFSFYQKLKHVDFSEALKEIAAMQGITHAESRVVATFYYRDENNNVIYVKERIEPGRDGRKKEFRFKHEEEEGGAWVNGRGHDPVPHNLPALMSSQYAIITEGEAKDDLLTSWGLVATCLDSGAKSPWRDDYLKYFKDKEKITVLPDNDAPGQDYALKIAHALHGHVKEIKIVDLPGLAEKGDIIDWAKIAGNDKERLIEIIKGTPAWTPGQSEKEECKAARTPVVVELSTVQAETVQWLWQDYIPLGKVTLVDGDPGLGKSTFCLDIAARNSTGAPMPDGNPGMRGGTVLLTLEDGLADTVVPRLTAMGADLSRIVALQGVAYSDGTSRFVTISDIDVIEEAVKRVSAKLLIVDPLMGYLGSEVNSHRDQDVRQALGPLSRLADKLNLSVVVIRHLNKSGGSQSIYRGGGSIGIIGAARCGYLIAKDPQDENKRVIACIKNNLAPMPPSLSFHIESVDTTSRIAWDGVSSHSADALLAIPVSEEERSALDEAKDFLLEILAESSVDSKEIQKQAKAAGISERTLQRAKKILNVKSQKSDFKGVWVWSLYEDCQKTSKIAKENIGNLRGELATFGENTPILEGD